LAEKYFKVGRVDVQDRENAFPWLILSFSSCLVSKYFCSFDTFSKNKIIIHWQLSLYLLSTVKLGYNELGYNELGYNELGYNELGYNELPLITN
jgi:hypothetical protein